jgi:hypothetical protein
MAYVSRRVALMDKTREELDGAMRELARAEVNAITSGLGTDIKLLSERLAQLTDRLDGGDEKIADLLEKAHAIKLQEALRDKEEVRWVMETFATKGDVEGLNKRIDGLRDSIASALAERVSAVRKAGL